MKVTIEELEAYLLDHYSNEWCEPVTDEQYNRAKIERF